MRAVANIFGHIAKLRNAQVDLYIGYEVFEVIDDAIDETHPAAERDGSLLVTDFARATNIRLTTIHPAAVYGGRNSGDGVTDYMENLASRIWHRLPFDDAGERIEFFFT